MEQLKTVTTSAPGKIILCGEHAVVYGIEAVACAINLRTKCCANILDDARQLRLSFRELDIEQTWEMDEINCLYESGTISHQKLDELISHNYNDLQKLALQVVLNLYLIIAVDRFKTTHTGLHLSITTQLPIGSGLGSSASLSVSLASSLLILCGWIDVDQTYWTEDAFNIINKYAFKGEEIIHGQPSGIDNTTLTFGHFLSFKAGNIQRLPELNETKLDVLVVNTKQPRSTKVLVRKVKEKKEKFPELYDSIFQSMGHITECLKVSLLKVSNEVEDIAGCYSDIEHLIDVNQSLLESIGVGHADISKIIEVCRSHSLHGKLTGAGGGGCVFVLLPLNIDEEKLKTVVEELTSLNYECFRTSLGSNGVCLEDAS